jgi:hypothetical protein
MDNEDAPTLQPLGERHGNIPRATRMAASAVTLEAVVELTKRADARVFVEPYPRVRWRAAT